MTDILVSGASVAGTAAAYWLSRQGFSVTVVERHDGPRPGGQAIDVRGPALTVLARMGLLDAANARRTRIRGVSFVDRDGNELSRNTESTPTGGVIDSPDIEILRDDLVELLYGATQPDTEYLFADSIAALQHRGDSVSVTFERGPARSFDLVIGADGLHSNVRKLVFGPEAAFAKRLGTYVAIFSVPNFTDLDYWETFHLGEHTSVALLGAYILAGELAAAGGDPVMGFGNNGAAFGDYILGNQGLASDDAPGGEPIPLADRERVIGSLTLKDY